MSDEAHPDVVCVRDPGVRWRVFELECCQKHLGLTVDVTPQQVSWNDIANCGAKYVVWKLHTESTTPSVLDKCIDIAEHLPNVKHINDPRHWMACHAKERAFAVWQRVGIPCPKWFEFDSEQQFFNRCDITYPILLRLNNSTCGAYSWLVRNAAEARHRLPQLLASRHVHHDGFDSDGVGRKFIAVQFIDTGRKENVNMSMRIIVAGSHVITGYARLGPASDWIAITNRFDSSMEAAFVKYQRMCQSFCKTNEAELVKAVQSLGLNFQGVDVIFNQSDAPYYLEVQPGFSVGYANVHTWEPPYYNPSRPAALVEFLKRNDSRLRPELPMYYNLWLDKYAMFDAAFTSLKESFDDV